MKIASLRNYAIHYRARQFILQRKFSFGDITNFFFSANAFGFEHHEAVLDSDEAEKLLGTEEVQNLIDGAEDTVLPKSAYAFFIPVGLLAIMSLMLHWYGGEMVSPSLRRIISALVVLALVAMVVTVGLRLRYEAKLLKRLGIRKRFSAGTREDRAAKRERLFNRVGAYSFGARVRKCALLVFGDIMLKGWTVAAIYITMFEDVNVPNEVAWAGMAVALVYLQLIIGGYRTEICYISLPNE